MTHSKRKVNLRNLWMKMISSYPSIMRSIMISFKAPTWIKRKNNLQGLSKVTKKRQITLMTAQH